MKEKFTLYEEERSGRTIVVIQLGNRSIGSLLFERDDLSLKEDLKPLIEKWNNEREDRI